MSERKWLRVVELDVVKHAPGHTMVCILNSANFTVGTPFFVPDGYALDAPDDERWRKERDEWRDCAAELERGRDSWARYAGSVCKERDTLHDQRGALRDRVRELERELDEVCQERDGAQSDLSTLETRWTEAKRERDEARREAEAARARSNADRNATNKACRERDAARREAAELRQELGELQEGVDHLRAENERLQRETSRRREAGNVLHRRVDALRWGLGTREAPPHIQDALDGWAQVDGEGPDQPAPQTHYRVGDLVLSTDGPVRLVRLVRIQSDAPGVEHWKADPHDVALPPGERAILERDGVPTDEGLRRLAEKAGVKFLLSDAGCRVSWTDEHVYLGPPADSDDRRALAAALREMGGA